MTIEQIRSQMIASIWQAIAHSGVDTSTLPREQLNKLVDAIADGVMGTANTIIAEGGSAQELAAAAADAPRHADEQTLWEGRPYLSLTEYYLITSERVRIIRGLLGKDREDIELIRIQDLDQSQSISERMLGIGDISIQTSDASAPAIVLRNVSQPQEVHEILRRAWLDARQRYRVGFREQL
jgi:hypothetical protein